MNRVLVLGRGRGGPAGESGSDVSASQVVGEVDSLEQFRVHDSEFDRKGDDASAQATGTGEGASDRSSGTVPRGAAPSLFARELWIDVQRAFEATHGASVTALWFSQVHPLSFTKGVFTLAAPNEVVLEWLDKKYRPAIESIFRDLTGSAVKVLLKLEVALPIVARDLEGPEVANGDVDLSTPLVVRAENRLAHAALARQLADPSSGNPVFVYGPQGCGKSLLVRHHLAQFAERYAGARSTVTVHAEAFSQGLVRALKDNDLSAFRGRMLAADVFVLEEAHRLRGKPRTQREFLSILRYHIERGRPVILTSRHPPNGIFLLDEALRSYFLAGILARVSEYPDPARVAILCELTKRHRRPVPQETIERIVARSPGAFDRAVRLLERTAAFAALSGQDATLEFLAERFPELAGGNGIELDIKVLIDLAAREFGTTPDDIASNRKVRTAVLGRHVVVYIATLVFNMKANRVMRHLGGLSPSTTAYARRRVEILRRDDPIFDSRIRQLLDRLARGQKLLF